jgi:hypothetical protein
MILAIILLSSLSSTGFMQIGSTASGQSATQTTAQSGNANGQNQVTSQSGTPSSQSNGPSPSAAAKPASKSSTTATRPHRKKVTPAACDVTAASASGAAASTNTAQTTPANCPPKKTVVRQGGTSEPSIQLEPGPVGEQASQQKDSTNQMLGATEQNLKKLDGRQLSPDQQNMVSQARQYINQAKDAMTAGNFDRAHTLAWKAQLLSEDLINPEK